VPISIHLVGLASTEVRDEIRQLELRANHKIDFFPALPEKQLFDFIAKHEIGLALEIGEPLNRDLCRTNKLYTYPLAGCYTLASKTTSQIHFIKEFPDAGVLIALEDQESVAATVRAMYENRKQILEKRKRAWLLSQNKLNWEVESKKLLAVIDEILAN
jgi:glycosyltransferase involved in cell wall biosynthesis